MGKKGKEDKKDSEDHNVHTLLGQPALVQIVDRGLTGKSDQEKKVSFDRVFIIVVLAIYLIEVTFKNIHKSIYFQTFKDMIKKIANQCATFDGKGKLTVDDLYSVIKVQVKVCIFVSTRCSPQHIVKISIQNHTDVVHHLR